MVKVKEGLVGWGGKGAKPVMRTVMGRGVGWGGGIVGGGWGGGGRCGDAGWYVGCGEGMLERGGCVSWGGMRWYGYWELWLQVLRVMQQGASDGMQCGWVIE